ncbi:hypothetical protein [Leptospira andrefontaineae]|uniref:Uncharacterized protein n=1 Tax=Leptospira andrefontaineae TaxID=2484976 RepID=A0A4R9H7C3_9LEPT|nr:hypothetical protein [Leptospira andrefontaineae]TGK41526.1 hypothetical protein EHO65_08910 [Leptospira andrefontaineae]
MIGKKKITIFAALVFILIYPVHCSYIRQQIFSIFFEGINTKSSFDLRAISLLPWDSVVITSSGDSVPVPICKRVNEILGFSLRGQSLDSVLFTFLLNGTIIGSYEFDRYRLPVYFKQCHDEKNQLSGIKYYRYDQAVFKLKDDYAVPNCPIKDEASMDKRNDPHWICLQNVD